MRKTRFIALLLVAILTLLCIAPATTYAADTSDSSTEEAVGSASPYFLKTKQDNSDANKVQVWLELDPTKAESVASYQVALQLMSGEGSSVLGRGMELTFDETLDKKAKIKEADFDPNTQIMQIYVAGTENLIQITKDEKGNTVNKLPIGTLQVEKLKGEENTFKIGLSANTGDLTTVDLGMNSINVAETYGADFEIPVDGVVYGEPLGVQVVMADGKMNIVVKAYEGAEITIGGVEGSSLALAPADAADFNKKYAVTVNGENVGTFTMNKYISKLEDDSDAVEALRAFETYAEAAANVFRGAAYDVNVGKYEYDDGLDGKPYVRDEAFCSVSIDCSAQTRLIVYVDGVDVGTPIMVNDAETDLVTLDCGSTYHSAAAVPVNDFNVPVKITVDGKTIEYSVMQATILLSEVEGYEDLANAMAWYGKAIAEYGYSLGGN